MNEYSEKILNCKFKFWRIKSWKKLKDTLDTSVCDGNSWLPTDYIWNEFQSRNGGDLWDRKNQTFHLGLEARRCSFNLGHTSFWKLIKGHGGRKLFTSMLSPGSCFHWHTESQVKHPPRGLRNFWIPGFSTHSQPLLD